MTCSVWSSDLTYGNNHYANNDYGDVDNMWDNNLATYCQSMSYVAVSGIDDVVSRITLATHNSTSRTQLVTDEPVLQGSNNSTDGLDGDWSTLVTIYSSDIIIPDSYPGWVVDKEFTNTTSYIWYRLSGLTNTTNTVLNEWELFSCTSHYYFEGYVYEEGAPVVRNLFLYIRDTGALVGTTTSSGNGYYYIDATTSGAHFLVCLDDAAGIDYNDLIIGNIYPSEF